MGDLGMDREQQPHQGVGDGAAVELHADTKDATSGLYWIHGRQHALQSMATTPILTR